MDENVSSFTNFVQDEAFAYLDNNLEMSSFDLLVTVSNPDRDSSADLLVPNDANAGLSILDPAIDMINHDEASLT